MKDVFGFLRVMAAVPRLEVAHCDYNVQHIKKQIDIAVKEGVEIVCFPELCLTGYSCADLFFTQQLQQNALAALQDLCVYTASLPLIVLVGAPIKVDNNLYNCAFVLHKGEIKGVVPKINLPNTGEFYEKRWFTPGRTNIPTINLFGQCVPFGSDLLFHADNCCFGIEICEDLWSPLPPSTQLAIQGAEVIFNLSSSNCLVGKHEFRQQMITQQSARVHCGYLYTSSGAGESTTDIVCSGSTYIAENGAMLNVGERFLQDSNYIISEIDVERLRTDRQRNTNFTADQTGHYRKIYIDTLCGACEPIHRTFCTTPFLPCHAERQSYCEDVFAIQTNALYRRWQHTHADTIIIGISGGLDSTLALLVAAKTADKLGYERTKIHAVTMPCFATSSRTKNNAIELMKLLGVTAHHIPIGTAVEEHLSLLNHDKETLDTTYENAQARYRTYLLMDMANQYNGLVLGTGDMSELALGWTTYCGDHMSMYGINAGIPKTLVQYLVEYLKDTHFNDPKTQQVLQDIVATPISPELLPQQDTQATVGPYRLHDFFLFYFLRYGFTKEKIAYMAELAFKNEYTKDDIHLWLNVFIQRFYTQQYKRSCLPDGPKAVSVSLSPRGDWRMPSDVKPI